MLAGVICCVGLRCLSCVGCCAVRRALMAAGCVLCCLFLVASPLFASTLIFVCRGLSRGRYSLWVRNVFSPRCISFVVSCWFDVAYVLFIVLVYSLYWRSANRLVSI